MHSFKSFRRTECEAGITLSNKPYEAVDINEMASDVYNATIDQSKRRSCEKEYGSGLKSSWYKLNELCMDLKPYFRMKQSNRKGIVTTLGKIYGSNLPMNVDFFQNIDASINDETASMSLSEQAPVAATKTCEEEATSGSTVYDKDWLYFPVH